MYKYNLSIISMFKNEATIIESWLKHYIEEGVEHFYLIDNGSTDHYESVIKPYLHKITLVKDSTRLPVVNCHGTQQILQNKYYLQKVKKESKWVFICDIDEYLFNSKNLTILDYISKTIVDCIYIIHIHYGSKLENTPHNLPLELIYREEFKNSNNGKTLLKSYNLKEIGCHNHITTKDTRETILYFNNDLKLNHYQIVSKDYYDNIRCKRGGGVHGLNEKYNTNLYDSKNDNFIKKIDNTLKDKKELKEWYKIYALNYDLKLNNYKEAYLHWINNKNINKTYKFILNDFNWEKYINNYKDLKERLPYNKESGWKHWLRYGKNEKRTYY